ncbi:unnamed protein product [Clavelina lepadiformis]|uniref:Mitochondrial S-adenosylmethionine carrier protein n=1 Tax=Clavelina lepadiformis TaxID=159417 RepID=A0ABP0GF78_CLALP
MHRQAAGLSVDIILFPFDTIKTRLQSKQGFFKTGGFHRLYAGLGSIALGSAPGAAVFFTAYEATRQAMDNHVQKNTRLQSMLSDMTAACTGEVVACGIRVPVEVVKQRAQVTSSGTVNVFMKCLREEGIVGFYRGYKSTVLREIPFSLIQFPLWEFSKATLAERQNGSITPWQSAWCGFFCGGFAAFTTTPLDVVKTRIMLAQKFDNDAQGRIIPIILTMYKKEGIRSLFTGALPRTFGISCGGFIFLGMFDLCKMLIGNSLL